MQTYDQPVVAADPAVRKVCSQAVMLASRRGRALRLPAADWEIQVLPPSESAFSSGARAYRCVVTEIGHQPSVSQFGASEVTHGAGAVSPKRARRRLRVPGGGGPTGTGRRTRPKCSTSSSRSSRTGREATTPALFRQPVADYIEHFHSTSSLARELMPAEEAAAFDRAVAALVRPHAVDGVLELPVAAELTWGRITVTAGS